MSLAAYVSETKKTKKPLPQLKPAEKSVIVISVVMKCYCFPPKFLDPLRLPV